MERKSQAQIDEVVRLLGEGLPRKSIARRTGVSPTTIANIVTGKRDTCRREDRYYNPSPQEIAGACAGFRANRYLPVPTAEQFSVLPIYDAVTLDRVA